VPKESNPRVEIPVIGQVLSHYRILEKLGEGGMGVVYKAQDLKLTRTVALKSLPHGFEAHEPERSRLIQEARATAILNHPHICTIHDIEEHEGQLFIVMEYVDGRTLRDLLPVKRIQDAIDYAVQIAEALQEAHAHGIIHRDIKTENIMVNSKNRVKVMDFGLAKFKGSLKLTRTGAKVGTVTHMAPEQIRGEQVDARSDIFSFGIVLYEMLTGRMPFGGDYEEALLYSILNAEPTPIRDLRPEVPLALEKICLRAMAKDPVDRYQTAADLLRDLEALRSGAEISSKTRRSPARKRRLLYAGLGVVALTIAIIATYHFLGTRGVRDRVAVLPFENLSKDSTGEILADGMSWEIIEKLQHVASLKVSSVNATMRFKGSQASYAEIARELDAKALVHGSIFHVNGRVRVIATLVDPETDGSLWSESYDDSLEDILSMQSKIAQGLVHAVRVEVTHNEETRLGESRKVDPKAYELYLKARETFYTAGSDEHQQRAALDLLEQAIALDSSYSPFYPFAVMMYHYGTFFGYWTQAEVMPRMRKAVERALALDAESAGSQMALGILDEAQWNWNGAEAAFSHALEISPGDAEIHQAYANMLQWRGRFDEAIARMKRAYEIDPSIDPHGFWMAAIYVNAGRFGDAIDKAKDFLRRFPDDPVLYLIMGFAYAQKGNCDTASVYLERSLEISSRDSWMEINCAQMYALCGQTRRAEEMLNHYVTTQKGRATESYNIASTYAILQDTSRAYMWLERAYRDRSQSLNGLKIDVAWDSQHSNPRYQDMLRRIGLDR
jgi:serine/threonine protein kinase/tetratricopeptide (TPR) repeat protein